MKTKIISYITITAISLSLVLTNVANATSTYDNVIATSTDTPTVSNDWTASGGACATGTPHTADLSTTWASYLLDSSKYINDTVGTEGSSFWSYLLDHPDSYAWSLSQITAQSDYTSVGGADMKTGDKALHITASTTRGAEFVSLYGTNELQTTGESTRDFYITYMNKTGGCKIGVSYTNNYGKTFVANESLTSSGYEKHYFINYDITYPDGYAGVYPPSSYTPTTNYTDTPKIVPDIKKWNGSFSDTNFNTYDTVPFTCNSELDPDIHYEIYDETGTETLLTSGVQSPSVPILYNFTHATSTKNYRIVTWYDCGVPPEIQFTDSTFVDFSIDSNGDSTVSWTAETCDITHLDGCVRNILHYLFDALGLPPFPQRDASGMFQVNTDTHGLTAIITSPIALLEGIQYGVTCYDLSVPLPYLGTNITLPCMYDWYNGFGDLFGIYQTVATGIVAYYVLVGMLNVIKGFKDPENDKIEVLKL